MSDDETIISEPLLEGNEQTRREMEEARTYINSGEKLLAIINGNVEGRTSLNRLALTERRIVFYPGAEGLLGSFVRENARSYDYGQIETIQGTKGTLLGEITLSAKNRIVRFRNMTKDDVDLVAGMISRRRALGDLASTKHP